MFWLPLAMLGGSLLTGLLSYKSKQKQADAARKAQQEKYAHEKAYWDSSEANRAARLRAINNSLGGSKYQLPSNDVEAMAAARPYAGSLPADPGAGLGYGFLSGLAGSATNLFGNIVSGHQLADAQGLQGLGRVIGDSSHLHGKAEPDTWCEDHPWDTTCPQMGDDYTVGQGMN